MEFQIVGKEGVIEKKVRYLEEVVEKITEASMEVRYVVI